MLSYQWTQEQSVLITHCVHSEKEGDGKLPLLSVLTADTSPACLSLQQLNTNERERNQLSAAGRRDN